jgi:N-methylhydantoinase B
MTVQPETTASDALRYDPVTFSVILSRFNEIVNEMTLTLEYTAWSSNLALAHDYSCAIYDAVPRQVAMYDALPIHTTSMHLVLAEIARTFEGDVNEGDVFLCNAPYRGNTHVGDVVTAEPVFADGELRFWSVTKGHQLDVGAFIPASVVPQAKNVWQEGLHIPPLKIHDRGKPREDVIDLYLSNLRYRDLLNGDLSAQLGSITKGRMRLQELIGEYGVETVMRYVDHMIEYSDRRMGEELSTVPDGVYNAVGWVDSDGADATDVPIKVAVTIDGDHATVDYTGSGPQSPSGLNGTEATAVGAGAIPFMYYIDPDIPHNHGCLSHVDSSAPLGTICNAAYPAATSAATIFPADLMQEVVNMALAPAAPDRVIAGGARASNLPGLSGIDPKTGTAWGTMLFNGAGGGGGSKGADGWPIFATAAAMAGQKSLAIEQIELLYPIVVNQMEAETDSMGVGVHLGGTGVRFELEPIGAPMEVVTFGDGLDNPPHGIIGGTPGIGGGQYVEGPDGHRRFVSANGYYVVADGERRISVSTGGGGYGNPIERDVEQVRRDVRDEIISRTVAFEEHGVVLSDDWDPVVDEVATAARRAELAAVERPLVLPGRPSAATWLADTMRPEDEYLINPGSAG